MVFNYAGIWLSNPNAVPLSYSLPLQKERFKRNDCRGFFAGILPEESKREMVARNLGISKGNDFAMLEQIGGECAGAVTFIPAGKELPKRADAYRKLTDYELCEILKLLPRRPLMAGEDGIRLSLAGAQDKIAVHVDGNTISVPLDGAPSTHILKPAIERFEGLVFNEAYCMKLATLVGLPTAKVEVRKVEEIDYLLVERYDRHINDTGFVDRLHQEDLCQAMGVVSEKKYQSEGGPSLKDCFALVREVSSRPVVDLANLLDAVIFNLLVGNHDAHGKNFSLVYTNYSAQVKFLAGERKAVNTRLAPLYDLVSTIFYPELTTKMAMKIGKEAESFKIFPHHFEKLAEDAGLSKPMVLKRVTELAEEIRESLGKVELTHTVVDSLSTLINKRCEMFLGRFIKNS
jgi:serine/threonine-protein kinase HipA